MDFDPGVYQSLLGIRDCPKKNLIVYEADCLGLILHHGDQLGLVFAFCLTREANDDTVKRGDDFEILRFDRLANGLFV